MSKGALRQNSFIKNEFEFLEQSYFNHINTYFQPLFCAVFR